MASARPNPDNATTVRARTCLRESLILSHPFHEYSNAGVAETL
jgi:hypothetical protein